jgi:hypothetical protein
MLQREIDQFVTVDQADVSLVTSKTTSLRCELRERHHEAELSLQCQCAGERGHVRQADIASAALDLDLYDRGFKTELIAVGDDIDPAICPFGRDACLVAHGIEEMPNIPSEWMAFQLDLKLLANEVARILLDIVGDLSNGRVVIAPDRLDLIPFV